uniref:RNA-directed DNA polymerase, eukaryota n=1 Tax=Tanacetum cinerariifolium TaxID=118510 RepID=A0A6L2PAF2_TANCI|nr:RNA-directed DNA polymerase, eukaryota [Tanacetum cinerariifolium]
MEKIKKRLSNWKMNMLSIRGRLTLVKSVLGYMPLYQFSLFKLPMGVLNYIETLRSHFLNGCASNNKKAIWMNWKNALAPKDRGGLGHPWGRWKNWFEYKGGYGSCWTNIVQEFYSLVDKGVNVFQYLRNPRGGLEMDQLANLKDLMKEVYLNSNADRWSWLLDKSGFFAVSSVRNLIDEKILPKTEFQTKIKIDVHTWKIMTNSLPTWFNISCHGILIDSIKCPICDQGVETSSHLFFTCLMIDSVHILVKNKSLLEGVFQVMWWLLWYFRNKTIFEAKVPRKALFFDEVVRLNLNKTQGASTPKEVKRMKTVPYASAVESIMYATGYVFILKGGTLEWKSSKQSTTVMSSTKVEYITALEAAIEAVWIRKFISGLGLVPTIKEPIRMFCDNSAALHFANELGVQRHPRHYHRRYHYVYESITLGEIRFLKVYTDDNLVDPFTKTVSKGKLTQHARSMGLCLASSFM